MTVIEVEPEVRDAMEALDDTVESPERAELTAETAEYVSTEPDEVDDGGPGTESAMLSRTLEDTGLELAARRVLARRGIETADAQRVNGMESLRAPGRLPDILEASEPMRPADTPLTESIILDEDGDGRERVFDTDQYPYSAIAALEITTADGKLYSGTGWFVSPRTLITAGHCVFVHNAKSPGTNGWVRSIRVIPGRNGTGGGKTEPFGAVTSTRFLTVKQWRDDADPEFDYGAIILPEGASPNGAKVGMLGLAVYNDAALTALNLNVAGYPGDKEGTEAQTLWFDAKKTRFVTPRKVFYDVDTFGGQSGAPVFVVQGQNRRVVAVHAYGTSAKATSNSGTRITSDVLKRIQGWKA